MTSPFTRFDLAFLALLTAALSTAICVAARSVDWPVILVLAALNAAALALGRAVLPKWIGVFPAGAAYVMGMLLASLAVVALCLLFTLSAGPAALITGAAILPITWRRVPSRAGAGWPDLFAAAIAGAATIIWSWQAITVMPHLAATGRFDGWTDYYLHAGEIAQFAAFRALHGTTIFAAGAPLPPYHYASYALPAALSGLTQLPALTAATAFWTPLSILLLGLAAAVTGGALGGESGGFLAFAAVMLVPSASHYGLENPFFDVHWLLEISSSGGYALACACLSLTCLIEWLREPRPAPLAWAAGLALATATFRVQIFAPLAPTCAIMFLAAWRPRHAWRRPALAGGGAAVILAVMLALEHLQRAPHFFTGPHHPIDELLMMHAMAPSAYAGFYAHIAVTGPDTMWHRVTVLGLGILLLLAAAFGLFLPLYVATLLRRARRLEMFIPLAASASYLAILLLFPSTPAEKLEFAHRPYIFVYVLLAIWCGAFAARWLRPVPAATLCVPGLISPLWLAPAAQCSGLNWGFLLCDVPVPPGLIAAATYLRTHAAPAAVIAMPPSPLDEVFLALSQRPEFSPGTDFTQIQSGLPPAGLAARAAALNAFLATGTQTTPRIAWRVAFPPTSTAHAAFATAGFAVQKTP